MTQLLGFTSTSDTIPNVSPVVETPSLDKANDPAIYLHPDNPEKSFVIATSQDSGLRVYNLTGKELQSITPEGISYNNVDIAYGVEYQTMLVGETASVDLAIASDRENDTLAIFAINPDPGNVGETSETPLQDVTAINIPQSIFGVNDGETTASGLATYTSPVDGKTYAFVSQANGNKIAQLEIKAGLGTADEFIVNAEVVRILEVPIAGGEEAEGVQVEGIVVDREKGILYLAQEKFGIWKVDAEVNGSDQFTLVDTVSGDTDLAPTPFSNLVVFGDSLSDTGNLFNATEGLIPPSPPYFEGRFSNGDLAVEAIADSLELSGSESFFIGGSNYAFGGAKTGDGTSVTQGVDVPNLGEQIELYLSTQTPTETDLFYVYGGGNDFIDTVSQGQTIPNPEDVVDNIITHITELAERGAKTFIVPNLPPLGNIPLFSGQQEAQALLDVITDEFNQLIDTELDAIAAELGVTIIEPDFNSITEEILTNPDEFGFTNTTAPVLDLNSGTLIGNPDEFFFWDLVHPTAAATDIFAQETIEISPDGIAAPPPSLVPDVEGLTIYYGEEGNGYLVASSQGNSTFAIYDRAGSNSYLGSFAITNVEESEAIDVINVPLGEEYSAGLLVVQDGLNEPEGELENFNTNYKYVSLEDFKELFPNLTPYDPNAFDPRNPEAR